MFWGEEKNWQDAEVYLETAQFCWLLENFTSRSTGKNVLIKVKQTFSFRIFAKIHFQCLRKWRTKIAKIFAKTKNLAKICKDPCMASFIFFNVHKVQIIPFKKISPLPWTIFFLTSLPLSTFLHTLHSCPFLPSSVWHTWRTISESLNWTKKSVANIMSNTGLKILLKSTVRHSV